MTIGVCITTRHRPDLLGECLSCIDKSTLVPDEVSVSDDSSEPAMIEETKRVVAAHPRARYLRGPRKGVCANRNHALSGLGPVDYVAFLDDDALVAPEYFSRAQARYDAMEPARRARTILSGVRIDDKGARSGPTRLNFRGYFVGTDRTEVAGASYAVYPRAFFDAHKWDELIFFGYEDAELSLRALHDGYEIVHCEDLEMIDAGKDKSTFLGEKEKKVDRYAFTGEAARLYVGVKRFKEIERSYPKLAAFLSLYFGQITYSLAKRRALGSLPELLRLSNVRALAPWPLGTARGSSR